MRLLEVDGGTALAVGRDDGADVHEARHAVALPVHHLVVLAWWWGVGALEDDGG